MTKITPLLLLFSALCTASVAADTDAKDLYLGKCASCHGKRGELKALNTSRPIASLTAAQIAAALNGYKDGSPDRGGAQRLQRRQLRRQT